MAVISGLLKSSEKMTEYTMRKEKVEKSMDRMMTGKKEHAKL